MSGSGAIWLEQALQAIQEVMEKVNQVILGKEQEIRQIMLAFLANGHVLLEDMYRQVVGALYRGLPAWKKPAFKYGGNFL